MNLQTAGGRAALLAIIIVSGFVVDCFVALIVKHYFHSVPYGFILADTLIASAGVLFCLYHWSISLAHYALLIAYQYGQTGNNEKDFSAYIGGVLSTALIVTAVDYIVGSPKPQRYEL